MVSRIRPRTVKVPPGASAVRIPHQRGSRSAQALLVIVPERPSWTRVVLGWAGGLLWDHRRALAPTAIELAVLAFTAVLHSRATWSGLVLAPLSLVPLVWFALTHRRRPATGSVRAWRAALALLACASLAWAALAAGFGPLAGPLELIWLLLLVAAQSAWLIVHRSH